MMTMNTMIAGLSLFAPVGGLVPLSASICDIVAVHAEDELTGSVQSVDWEAMTFSLMVDEKDSAKQVSWNEQTSFTLDGEEATAKEVLIAMGKVKVAMGEDDHAASVARVTE